MNNYKSWSALNKKLSSLLCSELSGRITYFLTRYHKVHNSYGRAAVRLDGRELVCFSWINMYYQERDLDVLCRELCGELDYCDEVPELKEKWDKNATYYEADFLNAATEFLNMPISDALQSENLIIKMFAILDRRTGKRTLEKIMKNEDYKNYPEWLRQFYELRV